MGIFFFFYLNILYPVENMFIMNDLFSHNFLIILVIKLSNFVNFGYGIGTADNDLVASNYDW